MRQLKFNELPLTEKAIILAEYGRHAMSIDMHGFRVHLYAINSHYTEVYFNVFTRQVERIEMIAKDGLDKYVSHISIRTLFFK
jgi:hypothetical protein